MSITLEIAGLEDALNAAGLLNSSSLGSHTIGMILKAAGIANSSLLGSPSLVQMLNPPGIDTTAAVGAPSVNQSITAPSIVNASAYGSHTLNQGIKAGGLINVTEYGNPVVNPGKVILSPAGLIDQGTVGSPTLYYKVNPPGINNVSVLGDIFVTHIYEGAGVYPPSIANLSVFGDPQINLKVTVPGIAPVAPVFGAHSVVSVPKLIVGSILNVSEFGAFTVKLTVQPSGIENETLFGNHKAQVVKQIFVDPYVNTSFCGDPSVRQLVKPNGLLNQSELGIHAISYGALKPTSIINLNYLGNHQVSIEVGTSDKFIRDGGQWKAVETLMVKYDNAWHELGAILEKQGGVWVQIY